MKSEELRVKNEEGRGKRDIVNIKYGAVYVFRNKNAGGSLWTAGVFVTKAR